LSINPQLNLEQAGEFGLLGLSGWQSDDEKQVFATLKLDITRDEDTMFAGLNKATRREIRRAERAGMTVRAASRRKDFEDFFEIYSARAKTKELKSLPQSRFYNLADRLLSTTDRGALFLAELGGTLLGGAVILRAGTVAHYVYGAAAVERDANLPISHLPIWHAIRWAKEIGCAQFDFGGGGDGPRTVSSVNRFKQGFGGTSLTFMPSMHLILRPGISRLRDLMRLATR
jgi:lipid II:glycine glycyltransferase (peptidoglycan interpeptide bridge formation enzyme)